MMWRNNTLADQRGITLVELMVALVVSSIVLIGVATVYTSSKRAYTIQEEFARLQENARFAFVELTTALRQAGYMGATPTCKNFLRNDTTDSLNILDGINGYEYVGANTKPGADYTITSLTDTGLQTDWIAPDGDDSDTNNDNLPDWLAGRVLVGNDVVIVSYFQTPTCNGVGLNACFVDPVAFNPTAAALPLSGNCPIAKGAFVIANDGATCDLFQNVTNINAAALSRGAAIGLLNPGNINPGDEDWSIKPIAQGGHHNNQTGSDSNARILTGTYTAYYIGIGASGEPALFRADYNDPCVNSSGATYQELVEGVENMQILYGIDNTPADDNFQPDQFVTADPLDLSGFDNVVAVRISLLVRTPQETNRPQQAGSYRLLGVENATSVDVTPIADRRVRKVFTTTIQLRNKAFYRKGFDDEF